jgi:hypothetical protein
MKGKSHSAHDIPTFKPTCDEYRSLRPRNHCLLVWEEHYRSSLFSTQAKFHAVAVKEEAGLIYMKWLAKHKTFITYFISIRPKMIKQRMTHVKTIQVQR